MPSTACTIPSGSAPFTGRSHFSPELKRRLLISNRYIGALSNSGRRTANYIGFYKGLQSAGAAVMWSMDAQWTDFMTEFVSYWVLLSLSLICAAPVVFRKITDHSPWELDLQNTDETVEDVISADEPAVRIVEVV